MPVIQTTGINAIKGLSGLSVKDREQWQAEQRQLGKLKPGASTAYMERLYKNQQFVTKYGVDKFNSMTPKQRDAYFKEDLAQTAIAAKFSPYQKRDSNGKIIGASKTPIAGNGMAPDEYERVSRWSADNKLALLDSGYLPNNDLQKRFKEALKREEEFNKKYPQGFGLRPEENAFDMQQMRKQGMEASHALRLEENNNKFAKIEEKELNERKNLMSPYISAAATKLSQELQGDELFQEFWKAINRSSTSMGNHVLRAQFNDDGTPRTKAGREITPEFMLNYLATQGVLSQAMGYQDVWQTQINDALKFVDDNTTSWEEAKKIGNEVALVGSSYLASQINGFRTLGKYFAGNSEVWQDPEGNVIGNKDPRLKQAGKQFYYMKDGKAVPLHRATLSQADLDYMGKDADGNDYHPFFNNAFWRDAERFNTFDLKELERARRIGFSDMSPVYKPGEESSLSKEVLKMAGFAVVDGILMVAPTALGGISKLSQLGKLGRLGRGISSVTNFTSKVMQKGVLPVSSAVGIGHSYSINTYGEGVEHNLTALQGKYQKKASDDFSNAYASDQKFKKQIDSEIQSIAAKEKAELVAAGETNIDDAQLLKYAESVVRDKYINQNYKDYQISDDYNKDLAEAYETATDAATLMAITDAAKYGLVNFLGYRSFLFKSPTDKARKFFGGVGKGISKEGKTIVRDTADDVTNHILGNTLKFGAKHFWGGAWTNFTDEMQAWGSRLVNDRSYNAYLNGDLSGEATADYSSAYASYLQGAMQALFKGTTWRAGLIGGLGSIANLPINASGVARLMTKEGRHQWSQSTKTGKMAMLFNNGILSEFASRQDAERQVDSAIAAVNRFVADGGNIDQIIEAIAAQKATEAEQDPTAQQAIINAIKSISLLSEINPLTDSNTDPTVLDMVSSKSEELQQALQLIDNLTKGNFTEEKAKDLLAEYYAKNKNVVKSEENDRKALEQLTYNARVLQEAYNIYNEVKGKLEDYEKSSGTEINSWVKNKLIERTALGRILTNGFNEVSKKLNGEPSVISVGEENGEASFVGTETTAAQLGTSPFDAPIGVFGTKESIEKQVKALELERKEILKDLEANKERAEQAQKDYDEFKQLIKEQPGKRRSDRMQDQYTLAVLKAKAEQAQRSVENTQRLIDRREALTDRLRDAVEKADNKVLSEAEILGLDPISMARMLNENNRRNYSTEQQAEIDKAITTLKQRAGDNALELVQQRGKLASEIRANDAAYELMFNDPQGAYDAYMNRLFESIDNIEATFNYQNLEAFKDMVRTLETEPGLTDQQIREHLFKALTMKDGMPLRPSTLARMEAALESTDDAQYNDIRKYKDILVKAKEALRTIADLNDAYGALEKDDVTRENVSKALLDIFSELLNSGKILSREDIVARLEEITNSSEYDVYFKSNVQQLLDKYNEVIRQRKATTTSADMYNKLVVQRKEKAAEEALNAAGEIENTVERAKKEKRDAAIKRINDYIEWAKSTVTFDRENHTYYVNGEEVDYSVTQYIDHLYNNNFNPIHEFAGTLGNGVDAISRDYFQYLFFGGQDPSTKSYTNYSDAARDRIIADLKKTHEAFKKKFGNTYIAITSEIPLVGSFVDANGNKVTVGGTIDAIIIDQNGDAHIIDFKTKKDQTLSSYNNDRNYTFQQNAYKQLLAANMGLQAKSLSLLWFNHKYPSVQKVTDGIMYHYETDKNTGEVIVYQLKPSKFSLRNKKDRVVVEDQTTKAKKFFIKERIGTIKDLDKWETPRLKDNAEDSIIPITLQDSNSPLNNLRRVKVENTESNNQQSNTETRETPIEEEGRTLGEFSANKNSKGSYKVTTRDDGTLTVEFQPKNSNSKERGDVRRITITPLEEYTIDYATQDKPSVTGHQAELIANSLFPELKNYTNHRYRGGESTNGVVNKPYWIQRASRELTDATEPWVSYWIPSRQGVLRTAIRLGAEAGLLSNNYSTWADSREIPSTVLRAAVKAFTRLGITSPAELSRFIEKNTGKDVSNLYKNARTNRATARNLKLQERKGREEASQQVVRARFTDTIKKRIKRRGITEQLKRQADRGVKRLKTLESRIGNNDEKAVKEAINIIDSYRQRQSDYRNLHPTEHDEYINQLENKIKELGYTWHTMRGDILSFEEVGKDTKIEELNGIYDDIVVAGDMTPRITKDGTVIQQPKGTVYMGKPKPVEQTTATETEEITEESLKNIPSELVIEEEEETQEESLPETSLVDNTKEEAEIVNQDFLTYPVSSQDSKGNVIEGKYTVSEVSYPWDNFDGLEFNFTPIPGLPSDLTARQGLTAAQLEALGINIKAMLPEKYKDKTIKEILIHGGTVDYEGNTILDIAVILKGGNRRKKTLDTIAGENAQIILREALPELANDILDAPKPKEAQEETKEEPTIEETSKQEEPKVEEQSETEVNPDIQIDDEKGTFFETDEEADLEEAEDATSLQLSQLEDVPDDDRSAASLNTVPGFYPLLGNVFYRYDGNSFRLTLTKKDRTPENANDTMSKVFNWFDSMGIKYQEIIDTELNRILKANPNTKIRFVFPNLTNKGVEADKVLKDVPLLAIEYDSTVASIHNKELGEPITVTDGVDMREKKFLVIGTLGFLGKDYQGHSESRTFWGNINDKSTTERNNFFGKALNPRTDKRFYALAKHTKVYNIGLGWLAATRGNFRTISDLLNSKEANPRKLKLQDLKWGIVFREGIKGVNFSEATYRSPKDIDENQGALFLYVEASNGDYIPAFIQPARYSELKEGTLKEEITSLFNQLLSPDYNIRIDALDKLRELVVLKSRNPLRVQDFNNQIFTKKDGSLTIRYDNSKYKGEETFDINDRSDENINRILDVLTNKLDPRINIKLTHLENPTRLQILDDAGALLTDLSQLYTSNADFTVLPVEEDGTIVSPPSPFESPTESPHPKQPEVIAAVKLANTVKLGQTIYEFVEGDWRERSTGNFVEDKKLLTQLEIISFINNLQLTPTTINGVDYYLDFDSESEPIIYKKVQGTSEYSMLTGEDALRIAKIINKKDVDAAQDKAAQEVLDRIEENPTPAQPEEAGETIDSETILHQQMGNFSDVSSQEEASKPKQKEVPKEETKSKEDQFGNKTFDEITELTDTPVRNFNQIIQEEGSELKIFMDDINDGRYPEVVERRGLNLPLNFRSFKKAVKEAGFVTEGIKDVDSWLKELKQCF